MITEFIGLVISQAIRTADQHPDLAQEAIGLGVSLIRPLVEGPPRQVMTKEEIDQAIKAYNQLKLKAGKGV